MDWWNGFFCGGAVVVGWMTLAFGCLVWMESATRKSRAMDAARSESEDSQL